MSVIDELMEKLNMTGREVSFSEPKERELFYLAAIFKLTGMVSAIRTEKEPLTKMQMVLRLYQEGEKIDHLALQASKAAMADNHVIDVIIKSAEEQTGGVFKPEAKPAGQ